MEKKLKRNISVLAVLGIMLLLAWLPMSTADSSHDFALDADDGYPYHAVYVDSAGEVGVGTESPAGPLHVVGDSWDITCIIDQDQVADADTYLEFRCDGARAAYLRADESDDSFDIVNDATGIYLDNGGHVGIGTASPAYELEVVGDLWLSGGTTCRRLALSSTNQRYFFQVEDSTFNGVGIYKAAPGTQEWVMAITTSNYVGIGTTSPDEKFEVEWSSNVDVEIGRGTSDPDITFIALRNSDGEKTFIYPNADQNGLHVTATHP